MPTIEFLDVNRVAALVGRSRQAIDRWVREGTFPPPLKLSAKAIVWRSDQVDGWLSTNGKRT